MTRDAMNRMYRDNVGTIVNTSYLSESCVGWIFKVPLQEKNIFNLW